MPEVFAAPVFVVVSALLGAAFVPGPILAATSGLLFGAFWGTVVTLSSAVASAVLALLLARRAVGGEPYEPGNARLRALAALARRRGFEAVVVQRLVPGMPDAPASYVFGTIGISVLHMALGTLVGAAPRAFSYTSIGASLDDPDSALAIVAVVGLVITGVVGAVLGRRLVMRR